MNVSILSPFLPVLELQNVFIVCPTQPVDGSWARFRALLHFLYAGDEILRSEPRNGCWADWRLQLGNRGKILGAFKAPWSFNEVASWPLRLQFWGKSMQITYFWKKIIAWQDLKPRYYMRFWPRKGCFQASEGMGQTCTLWDPGTHTFSSCCNWLSYSMFEQSNLDPHLMDHLMNSWPGVCSPLLNSWIMLNI